MIVRLNTDPENGLGLLLVTETTVIAAHYIALFPLMTADGIGTGIALVVLFADL